VASRLALALGLTLGLLSPPAGAVQAQAQAALQWYQHYEQGLDHAARGEWNAALDDFQEAARTRRDPAARVRTYGARFLFAYDPLYQQARCLAELGRLERSRELLAGAEAAAVTEPAALAALRERLDVLEDLRSREEPVAPTAAGPADVAPTEPAAAANGILVVRSSPRGARVRVDGRSVGTTPVDGVDVTPGRHRVELRLAGRDPWSEMVEARSGERLQLDVALGEPRERAGTSAPAPGAAADPVRQTGGGARPDAQTPPPTPAPGREEGDAGGAAGSDAPEPAAAEPSPPLSSADRPGGPDAAVSPVTPPDRRPPAGSTLLLAGAGLAVALALALIAGAAVRRRRRRGSPLRGPTLPGRIGRYRVTGELGRGGMATTYRAVRSRDGLPVAIKIPHETGDPTYLPRFLREGRLGETLHHPRIVRIVEAGEESGRPFLAMELIPGHTLRRALDEVRAAGEAGGAFALRRALEVVRDVAEAVDYAHGKGVVHRDLKPENVMLLPDGTIKVMDFGVARVDGQPGLTTSSFFFGSPVYAAPELVDPPSIDHRADLYSLGVVLFELLEGRPPFHHESVFKLIEMHQKEPLPDPGTLPHALSDEVWAVLRRLLAKDPADRYAGAQELLVDLERLLYELPGGARGGEDPGGRSQRRHLRQSSLGS
jgi:hypothetical protein